MLALQLGVPQGQPCPPVTWVSTVQIYCVSSCTGTVSLEGTGTPGGLRALHKYQGPPFVTFETAASGILSCPPKAQNKRMHVMSEEAKSQKGKGTD